MLPSIERKSATMRTLYLLLLAGIGFIYQCIVFGQYRSDPSQENAIL
jgi:hypothetical protein